jgi:NAD+ diphosphatase
MIQHIGSHVFRNQWGAFTPADEDKIYFFYRREVLTDPEGHLPRYRDVKNLGIGEFRYLFSIDQAHYFLAWTEEKVNLEGFFYHSDRDLRRQTPMRKALSGFTAVHLNGWYRSNRYCGRCGGEMVSGKDERRMDCPHCGNMVYPRLNPAIIVAVTAGERLMMTRYSPRSGHSVTHYVLIAGFIEIGETAEQAVEREVLEEVGLKVKNIRYFGSQPWGIDGNLTLGYTAQLDEGADTHVRVDESELADARWFERSAVPVPDDDLSITAAMIRAFAQGQL